jgi:hypothetical protein
MLVLLLVVVAGFHVYPLEFKQAGELQPTIFIENESI